MNWNRPWKYCPTDSIPADCLTQGMPVSQFKENSLWWNGPDWILDKWPQWNGNTSIQKCV